MRRQRILDGLFHYVGGNLLVRVSGGIEQIYQFAGTVDVQQPVQGIVDAQFLQGKLVALDAVAGAMEQGQVVEFVVALGSFRRRVEFARTPTSATMVSRRLA